MKPIRVSLYLRQCPPMAPLACLRLPTRIRLRTSHDPDSILSLFKSHGFSDSQIRRIIQTYPYFLSYNSRKIILPKLNFLLSKGASTPDLIRIITKNPKILRLSLYNSITPRYDFIKRFMLSDDSTLRSVKVCPCIMLSKNPLLNIEFLLHNGVPESKVVMLLRYWPPLSLPMPPLSRTRSRRLWNWASRPAKRCS